MCECQVCKDIKRWGDVFKNGDVYQRLKVFEEMFSRIEEAETDVQYYKALLNGTWPNAEEILESKLQLIRNKNASNISIS